MQYYLLMIFCTIHGSLADAAGPQHFLRTYYSKLTETKFVYSPEFQYHASPRSSVLNAKIERLLSLPSSEPSLDNPLLDLSVVQSKGLIIKEENRATFSQHASTLTEVAPGEFLAAWFGGSWEKNPDVGIWMSRFKVVSPEGALPLWNPVLFKVQATGEVLLFYKVGEDPGVWEGRITRSEDNGISWGPVEKMPAGIYGPVKNKPIVLQDGTILAGGSDEAEWTVHVEFSRDNGRTWERTSKIPFQGKILQPSLYVNGDGKVSMLCRSNNDRIQKRYIDNNIVVIHGDKSGLKWGKAIRTNLPNPNSGIDAVQLSDGRLLVVYNPNNDGGQRARASLSIAVSRDNGLTWRLAGQLERIDTAPRPYLWPEYSYPAVIQASDGKVHITYTYSYEVQRRGHEGRENIMHAVVDVMDLCRNC